MLAIEASLRAPAEWMYRALDVANGVVLACFALTLGLRAVRERRRLLREPSVVVAVLAVLVLLPVTPRLAAAAALVHDAGRLVRFVWRERPGERLLVDIGSRPARSLVL